MADEIILGDINIGSLLKAARVFEEFRRHLTTDQEKAGAIQAFEFTFEQSWKIIKKVLLKKGLECGSPRDCFRLAAQDGLINQPEQWFIYLAKRNLTSHTYNPEMVADIIAVFEGFSLDLDRLIVRLKSC